MVHTWGLRETKRDVVESIKVIFFAEKGVESEVVGILAFSEAATLFF